MKIYSTICCVLLPMSVLAQNDPAFNARYQVTFESDWSATTHPTDFPPNPHFSGLVGMTHNSDSHIWQMSETASAGIKQMAETGGRFILSNEINAMIADNTGAENLLTGGGIGLSPGMITYQFDISTNAPLVSLVSMIAPSPDWFVGVNGLSLKHNQRWQQQVVVELHAYDAGTDAGINYTSANMPIPSPGLPIELVAPNPPFMDNVSLGRFVFDLIETNGNFPLEGKYSGLYFNPERDGEGLSLTISQSPDGMRNSVIITFYTYREGQQMWLVGSGDFENGDDSISFELFRTEGAGFGMDFNPDDVNVVSWGNATLTIPSCDHLNLDVAATENPLETSSFQFTRLAAVAGLGCD